MELPPDQRPDGMNVAWIPGYWTWDDDRDDFIWVSGVWRDLPPGRQWVPGYWAPSGGGSQWISGFWSDVAQTEVTYLAPPPEPLEAGPSSPAPGPDTIWTPGSWVWQQSRYDWQPGYWVAQQPDWVWSPAHYVWTPRGYVYVQGYWDHDIVHRGVMFAPVYFEQPIYTRSDYYYSPSTIIDLSVILSSLFVQPRSHHYYFGDYYDRRYQDRGIYPWHSRHLARYGDDPIYTHYRSLQLHQDPEWDIHVDEQYRHRRDHEDARPAQTLALQVRRADARGDRGDDIGNIGRRLADEVKSPRLPVRFTPVNMEERRQIETQGREVHKFKTERAKIEAPPNTSRKPKRTREAESPVSMRLPASPVASRPIENIEGAKSPPPMPVAPKPEVAKAGKRHVTPQQVEARSGARSPKPPKARAVDTERQSADAGSASGKQPRNRQKSPGTGGKNK